VPHQDLSLLDELGLAAEPRLVHFDEVDFIRSEQMQPRYQTHHDPETMDRYFQAMKNGARLPAAVMWHIDNRYTIVSGNKRIATAVKIGDKEFWAYVVTSLRSDRVTLFAMTANIHNGLPLTKAEAVRSALNFMKVYKWSKADTARFFRISVQSLDNHLKCEKVRSECEQHGIQGLDKVPMTTWSQLASLRDRDVREEGAVLAVKAYQRGLNKRVFEEAISAAAKKPSSRESLEVLRRLEEQINGLVVSGSATREVRRRSRKDLLVDKIKGLGNNLRDCGSLAAIGIPTQDELREIESQWDELDQMARTMFAMECCA
jgi:hypothetical protein